MINYIPKMINYILKYESTERQKLDARLELAAAKSGKRIVPLRDVPAVCSPEDDRPATEEELASWLNPSRDRWLCQDCILKNGYSTRQNPVNPVVIGYFKSECHECGKLNNLFAVPAPSAYGPITVVDL